MWLPLTRPLLGMTWLTTQACALTGNLTGNPLVRRLVLNPLNTTSQGPNSLVLSNKKCILLLTISLKLGHLKDVIKDSSTFHLLVLLSSMSIMNVLKPDYLLFKRWLPQAQRSHLNTTCISFLRSRRPLLETPGSQPHQPPSCLMLTTE